MRPKTQLAFSLAASGPPWHAAAPNRSHLRFFLPGKRWRDSGDGGREDERTPPARPRVDLGPPLTTRERIVYVALAVIGVLPFLAFSVWLLVTQILPLDIP